jgi:sulfite exporter TauE/SafE/plastocyanin domain-containing protein/copper chaperone CopZ
MRVATRKQIVMVQGMVCESCGRKVEKALRALDGVKSAEADFVKGRAVVDYDDGRCDLERIGAAIREAGYETRGGGLSPLLTILAAGVLIFLLGRWSGGLDLAARLQNGATLTVLFVTGLLTSIHCVGMCGGLMLSQSLSAGAEPGRRDLKPVVLYNLGRVISYTSLGGLVGALGSVLSISLPVKAGLMLFAALFMVAMGLSLAGFGFARRLRIQLPWSRGHEDGQGRREARGPLMVGLLNGLMPCGPLQTMQLFALGTGSAVHGALAMLAFSLGTVPLMSALGLATAAMRGGRPRQILRLSGVLVLSLGLVMANRGLTLAGVRWPALRPAAPPPSAQASGRVGQAELRDGVQALTMVADARGYRPSLLYVQRNIPVEWTIDGRQLTSCNRQIIVPSLKTAMNLKPGPNVLKFTPTGGDIAFSCWMGMIGGLIRVVDDLGAVDVAKPDVDVPAGAGCCGDGTNACCSTGGGSPSIYGADMGQVPTGRIIKKAVIDGSTQVAAFKGIGFEFEPLVVVVQAGLRTKVVFDLGAFDSAEGEYSLIDTASGRTAKSFKAGSGLNAVFLDPAEAGAYAVVRGNEVLGVLEVVDRLAEVDLEQVRARYFEGP